MKSCLTEDQLDDYVYRRLEPADSERASAHVGACDECLDRALWLQSLEERVSELPQREEPRRDLWEGIARRITAANLEVDSSPTPSLWRSKKLWFSVAAAALIFISAIWLRSAQFAWRAEAVYGAPLLGGVAVLGNERMDRGSIVETDASSSARLTLPGLGHIVVAPETRVRLLGASFTEQRLELERGRIDVRVWAPPHLLVVDTPSATAVDLGCAYSLEVTDGKQTRLHVTSGLVSLRGMGAHANGFRCNEVQVPEGAHCETTPLGRLGTPYREDVSESFLKALRAVDREDPALLSEALQTVLDEARVVDALSLWHLFLSREGDARGAVYDRLAELVPPPRMVKREGALANRPWMLAAWEDELEVHWIAPSDRMHKLGRWMWSFWLGGDEE